MKSFSVVILLLVSCVLGSAQTEMRAKFLRQRLFHLNSQSRCVSGTGECVQRISFELPEDVQQLYFAFSTHEDKETEATTLGSALFQLVAQAVAHRAPYQIRAQIPQLVSSFPGAQDIDVAIIAPETRQVMEISDASQGIEIMSDLICGNQTLEISFENPQWFFGVFVDITVVAVVPEDQEAYRRGYTLVELANQARYSRQYLEAFEYYDQAITSFPHAEAFTGKAICWLIAGQEQFAKETIAEAAVHLGMQACADKKQADCRTELEQAKQRLGRWDEAWIDVFGFSISNALEECEELLE